jgi:rod shape determining protein RodA
MSTPLVNSPIRPMDDTVEQRRPGMRFELPLDPLLTLALIGLAVCSLVTLHGATKEDIPGDPNYYVLRQGIYFGVGFTLMVIISRFDYSRLRELRYGLYAIMIASIVAVMAIGTTSRGSKRAFELPFFNFQPSELGKLLLILALSAFVVSRVRRGNDRDTTARTMLLALIPAMLVIAQPDLGSGLVYIAIAIAVLFFAGISWKHFSALFALGAVSIALTLVVAPAVGVQVLKPYQVDRLTAFLNPSDDPSKQGYQQNQSRIAIGAGQRTGRGDNATQTRNNFLPEHHTDFIFAVVGETYGFVGCAIVLSLFALLIWRSLRILMMSKNLYGSLIAGGVLAMVAFQVFVNVGMNVGIAPITGVTLPLMSYGGSSVLVTLMAFGLLQSIYVQGRRNAAEKGRIAL